MRRTDHFRSASDGSDGLPADLYAWVLGLPWVVERPPAPELPAVRVFAVDCDLLGLHQVWLVTGLLRGVAAVVPKELGEDLETLGIARVLAPMPAGSVIVRVSDDADHSGIETVILRAYSSAMSSGIPTNL